jgi:NAD(P)-dependent dehydrogenase (short-subunit alcohol dehydrogenase family)
MAKSNWNADHIPSQKGRVVIITGATSGLGKEAARVLAGKGATVIMAVRNVEKGEKVAGEIQQEFTGADVVVRDLDLTSLSSIENFAKGIKEDYDRLDILINNAGIMACPYSKTQDGFEIQMGTNHLGHFALTGHLIPLMKKTKHSRIVATSSAAHNFGNIDFTDLNWENRKYKTNRAYGDSKLANLYFTYELAEKLKDGEEAPKVTAAHPGWTRTELQRHAGVLSFLNHFFSQGTEMGTLPTLRAALDPDAESGDYFGPAGFMEMQGYPVKVKSNKRSQDKEAAHRLWEVSEEMTGVSF